MVEAHNSVEPAKCNQLFKGGAVFREWSNIKLIPPESYRVAPLPVEHPPRWFGESGYSDHLGFAQPEMDSSGPNDYKDHLRGLPYYSGSLNSLPPII